MTSDVRLTPTGTMHSAAPKPSRPIAAALWMAAAQLSFALMNVLARSASLDVPWPMTACSRFFVGALVALVFARVRGASLVIQNHRMAMLRSMFGTCAAIGTFFTLANRTVGLGDIVTLFSTSPIWVALLSWPLLGEAVRPRALLSLALAFAGVVVVAHPTFDVGKGVLLSATATAFFTGIAMISLRKLGKSETGEAVTFHFATVAFVVTLILSVFVYRTPPLRAVGYLVLTGVTGGVAQIWMTKAYSLDSAVRVSVLGYLGLVFTRAFAALFFDEVPTVAQLLGSLLVIGAGASLALFTARTHTGEPRTAVR